METRELFSFEDDDYEPVTAGSAPAVEAPTAGDIPLSDAQRLLDEEGAGMGQEAADSGTSEWSDPDLGWNDAAANVLADMQARLEEAKSIDWDAHMRQEAAAEAAKEREEKAAVRLELVGEMIDRPEDPEFVQVVSTLAKPEARKTGAWAVLSTVILTLAILLAGAVAASVWLVAPQTEPEPQPTSSLVVDIDTLAP